MMVPFPESVLCNPTNPVKEKETSFDSLKLRTIQQWPHHCSSLSSSFQSSAVPSQDVLDAAEILADSGFVSMSLTLDLVSQSLVAQSPSLTIFAPRDAAFTRSGQPPLSLLQMHFCPLPLPLQTLKSLPAGTKIPTLLSGHSLVVTTPSSGAPISINNVLVTSGSPIYDDGFLIVFGIEHFFDPNFHLPTAVRSPSPDPVCGSASANGTGTVGFPGQSWFGGASKVLRSSGHTLTALFLDFQLLAFKTPTVMTVFAPFDQALANPLQDPSIFLRHFVPCRLMWGDLASFADGVVLPTYKQGFTIAISRSGNILLLNGAPVFFANMYFSDSIVVHGLRETLVIPEAVHDQSSTNDEGPSQDYEL